MKFSLARTAVALAATLTLASCGGGSGKPTYPVHVTVSNVLYEGLVLSTNGMDVSVPKPATDGADVNLTFPNEIEYGQVYNVVPKGSNLSASPVVYGTQPYHQTCLPNTVYPNNLPHTATAGQLATIQVNYVCTLNAYPLTGTVKGLTGTGLVLANGSTSSVTVTPATNSTTSASTGADVTFSLGKVYWNQTYGVTVLTQPSGQTCTVTSGGDNGKGAGTMRDSGTNNSLSDSTGVTDIVVTCVNAS